MGAQLFHLGTFPITPIKLVGIPLVAAALLLPRPRDAVPRPGAGILLLFAGFALFQVPGTTLSSLSFPATDASTLFSFAILMVATNLLISTQHRLQMTIRVIVLVETFASMWMYKQYYIYHWPRPIGPSSDPNYEALSLVVMVPLAIWMIALRKSRFVEMGRTDLHPASRIRRIPFAVARRVACASRDGGVGMDEFPA